MRFILTSEALARFELLRTQYQQERGVDLTKKASWLGTPTFMGGIDSDSRQAQISFLEKIVFILKPNFFNDSQIKTPEEWQTNLTASRVMVAACLYVQSQIGNSERRSVLYRLIEDNLGITAKNKLDEEDKELCFFAANRLINSSSMNLDQINIALHKANLGSISERSWSEFSTFLQTQCQLAKTENPYENYPITSITQPLFGAVFSYAGVTVGYISGDTISKSTVSMEPRYKLTALIGSSLLILGPVSPASIAIVAPVVAGKLITTFCSISLAHILGVTMGLLGQGVGIGVGLPLDLTYQLLRKAYRTIKHHYYDDKNEPKLTGLRLGDGMLVVNGLEFKMTTPDDELPAHDNTIEIKEDGEVYLNNQRVESSKPIAGFELSKFEEELDDWFFDKDAECDNSISEDDLLLAEQPF